MARKQEVAHQRLVLLLQQRTEQARETNAEKHGERHTYRERAFTLLGIEQVLDQVHSTLPRARAARLVACLELLGAFALDLLCFGNALWYAHVLHALLLGLEVDELHLELQRGVGRDGGWAAGGPVRVFRAAGEDGFLQSGRRHAGERMCVAAGQRPHTKRTSPTRIVAKPRSHPLITRPRPRGNWPSGGVRREWDEWDEDTAQPTLNTCPRSTELSNLVPSSRRPV